MGWYGNTYSTDLSSLYVSYLIVIFSRLIYNKKLLNSFQTWRPKCDIMCNLFTDRYCSELCSPWLYQQDTGVVCSIGLCMSLLYQFTSELLQQSMHFSYRISSLIFQPLSVLRITGQICMFYNDVRNQQEIMSETMRSICTQSLVLNVISIT